MDEPRAFEQSGELRPLRLVGHPDAVRWVARVLQESGRLVETTDALPDPSDRWHRAPVLWVARPDDATEIPVSETGLWVFPCLFVLRPEEDPGIVALPVHIAVEAYDVVREP